MKVKLLGLKSVDFTPQGEQPIKGVKVFICYPEQNTMGFVAEGFFICNSDSGLVAIDLQEFVGEDINVEFSRKGKVLAVSA